MVITGLTRNQVTEQSVRGFESLRFRHSQEVFYHSAFLRLLFVVTVSGYRNSDARLCLAIPSLCSLRIPPLPPQPRSRSWRVIESEVFCTSLFLSLCFLRLLFVVTVSGYRKYIRHFDKHRSAFAIFLNRFF